MDDISQMPAIEDDNSDFRVIHIIEDLCNKLRCSMLANDLDQVAKAHDLLTRFQHKEIFERILGANQDISTMNENIAHFTDLSHKQSLDQALVKELHNETMEELGEEEDCFKASLAIEDDLPENTWHGYFKGYQVLNDEIEFSICENKKCIEISNITTNDTLEAHLRSGVTCFCVDLFVGSIYEKQSLVVRLRQCEMRMSRELGFPVCTTLIAKLSPRLQYTGELDANLEVLPILEKNGEIILSIERVTSTHCSKDTIFVNATFLLLDVQVFDVICVGPDIQLTVIENKGEYLKCRVLIGGTLNSRMPVLFPGRCNKFQVSLEELEDITFCKEIGINIIVSSIIGTQEYCDDLIKTLGLFKCERMRLWASVFVNEREECEKDYKWAIECYDGFLLNLIPPTNPFRAEILQLHPAVENLINLAFQLQKPMICDPMTVGLKQYLVAEENYPHIFLYPEKYLFNYNGTRSSFLFFLLQKSVCEPLPKQILFKIPYNDNSLTGSDSLARAAVGCTFGTRVALILVLGVTGRMASKLAHFRPHVPIVFVTSMRSATSFVQVYHNVIMLYFFEKSGISHKTLLFEQILYGLAFAKHRKLIKNCDDVVLVYRKTKNTKFPDSYVIYKFDKKHFAAHILSIIEHKM